MKIKTSTHNQNINLNSSLFHIIRSKLYQKFNWSTKEDNRIKIIETGIDEFSFVKTNSNRIFYYNNIKNILLDIFSRYEFSHYEINQPAHKKYGIHRNHIDNLTNIKIDSITKKMLIDKMPIKKGETVVELGAFYGFGTMKLSDMVGNKGKVIAIEADKKNFQILKKNIDMNNISNVVTVNKGVWNESGKGTLYKIKNQGNSLVPEFLKNNSKDEIDIYTLDNILISNNLDSVDLISMEINGAEIEALQGMEKILSQNKLRIIAAGWYEHNNELSFKKLVSILEKNHFKVFVGVQNRVYALKD